MDSVQSNNQITCHVVNNFNCVVLSEKVKHKVAESGNGFFLVGDVFVDGQRVSLEKVAELYENNPNAQQWYAQLSGSFWIAVIDRAKQSAFMVNDHLGIQPCYYSMQHETLYISDSLQAIRSHENTQCSISKQAIFQYFYHHCIPSPYTIFSECSKLEPAMLTQFSEQGLLNKENLYNPLFSDQTGDVEALKKECMEVIEENVARTIKGNTGAFLSGGLDSSTVAGMLARHEKRDDGRAKTFSIGFKAEDYDETPYAELTAKHFDCDHKVYYLEPEQAAEQFVTVAQYFDEPFGNSSAMAAYFCAKFAKENGIDRLLAGDGGDELFAGNERYAKQKVFEVFHNAPGLLQSIPRAFFVNDVIGKLPVAKKVASYIRQADIPLPARLETYNFINQFGVENMFSDDFLEGIDTELPLKEQKARYDACTSEHPVDKMLYLDWKFTLTDNDLVKVSKMCELAGMEVEYPLLQKEVVDFSCKVSAETKLPENKLRDFYKGACKGFLADETLTKSKHGFGLPFGVWMRENEALMTLTMNCLEAFKKRNIVKASLIDNALEAHQNVHAGYYGELIWIMVILELWLQEKG